MNDALLALADHDAAIVRARHEAAHPVAATALAAATERLASLSSEKRALDEQRAPLTARAAALDAEATAARERAAVIAARLASATGAARDLTAMEDERRSLDARAAVLEDEQLEVLEALEPLDATEAVLRADAAEAVAQRDAAMTAADDERVAAAAVLDGLLADREALRAAVDPALLARYDKVAARTGGTGAARLIDGRCGGCRVAVPASIADLLLHAADADQIATCDECGRLLVR